MNICKHSIRLMGAAFLAAVAACEPSTPKAKIALALPLTGDIASLGQGLKRAAVMAVEEANASGKFPTPIEVVAYDDRSDPKEAVSVANRIVADSNVLGVIGHFNSGCSIPASRVYAQVGLPMISPASSNPELTEQQLTPQWTFQKTVFRVNTTDNVQGAYGADFAAKQLKAKTIAIVHDKTAYGQGVAEQFRKQFEANGGTVLAFEGLQVGDRDFRSLLTRVTAGKPDAIYFGGMFSEGGALVRQARDIGYKGAFLACEANLDPAFLNVAGPAAEGAYITFLGSPPDLLPSAKDFVERYKKRYPNDDLKSYDGYGYAAAQILLEAIAAAGQDRPKITEYLRGHTFSGVLGDVKFDEKGDTMNKTITLFQVQNGAFKPLVAPAATPTRS